MYMAKITMESFIAFMILIFSTLIIIFPDIAFAGTGGEELQDLVTKTEGMITGNGGKLVALAGFVIGVVWSAASQSLTKLVVPSVLGMVLGIGPSMVTGGISAII
jgi:hypothetical protein